MDEIIEILRPKKSPLETSGTDLKQWAINTFVYALQRQSFQLALDDLEKNKMIKTRLVDKKIYYKCK